MKSQSQRGVALVVTLIMLAVVTVMAVVFLGVSRRERASVGVAGSLTDSRLAADAGAVRAQSEVLARIAATDNPHDYDYFVSTNYINPAGFVSGLADVENVNYVYADGTPVRGDDLLRNLANLYLDPRPPVYIRTNTAANAPRPDDFRFFLDLNRNRVFDTNGWVFQRVNGLPAGPRFIFGDPEWVGVLEHPDLPHSSSNRFVARYAYLVLPAGKSLDINFIHNRSKFLNAGDLDGRSFYNRSQGVGSYELNLAAFLQTWLPGPDPFYPLAGYQPEPESLGESRGAAFYDAAGIVRYRYANGPRSVRDLWGAGAAYALRMIETNAVDDYAQRVYRFDANGQPVPLRSTDDPVTQDWPGADGFRAYATMSELFDTNKTWNIDPGSTVRSLALRLELAGVDAANTDRQYAFYRLLSQMGTDSLPAGRGKIHLNYTNGTWQTAPLRNGFWDYTQLENATVAALTNRRPVIVEGAETNLVPWTANPQTRQDFVMLTANAILKEQFREVFPRGLEQGIQVYPTNYYSGAVHRCFQLAANLLEANDPGVTGLQRSFVLANVRTNVAPFVFRPIYQTQMINGTNTITLVGVEEVEDDRPARMLRWMDTSDNAQAALVRPGDNIMGIPWIIGARKGWPSFNEFTAESVVSVIRRLAANRDPNSKRVTWLQSFQLGVSNVFGLESWNAYTQALGMPLDLYFTNMATMGLVDSNRSELYLGRRGLLQQFGPQPLVRTNREVTDWPARGFMVFTNQLQFVPESTTYLPGLSRGGGALLTNLSSVVYDPTPGFPAPEFHLEITNRVLYYSTAQINGTNRIVDLVTLNPMRAGFDVQQALVGSRNFFGNRNSSDPGRFWQTNRLVNSLMAMPAGLTNQIYVSTNEAAMLAEWANWSEDPVSGMQRERAIDEFRVFMGLPPIFDASRTNTPVLPIQVPYTPSVRLQQRMSWQANDPLVHFHAEDLMSHWSEPTNIVVLQTDLAEEGAIPGMPNLSEINGRYSPWGGRPGKQLTGQQFAYNPMVQDPGVRQADDWEFPQTALAQVGQLGRVHRGTPWQTLYLKSGEERMELWLRYAGPNRMNAYSHPTNDWRVLDLFKTSLNDDATRGLLGVNQTNAAAWAAVFGGLRVWTNTVTSVNPSATNNFTRLYVAPESPQMRWLIEGINAARTNRVGRSYRSMGDLLSASVLTDQSPFLNLAGMSSGQARITDSVYEAIPQQILGLVKTDEPYVVIYSYGQALQPAERSLYLSPGNYYGLCTNYQITGEALTKTAVRFNRNVVGTNVFYNAVVEDFATLPVD